MQSLLLATSNPGKIREITTLLAPLPCIAQSELAIAHAPETGLTFIENALQKARHAAQHCRLPCLAEDSGLVVPALDGEPGIYSARYSADNASDEDNIARLLERLKSVAETARNAYFYCAMVLLQYPEDPTPLIACGRVDGVITHTPQGREGFGYDPIFYYPPNQCTFAQLPRSIKNTISHRAQALTQLRSQLP